MLQDLVSALKFGCLQVAFLPDGVDLLLELLLVQLLRERVALEPVEFLEEFVVLLVEESFHFFVLVVLLQVILVGLPRELLELLPHPQETSLRVLVGQSNLEQVMDLLVDLLLPLVLLLLEFIQLAVQTVGLNLERVVQVLQTPHFLVLGVQFLQEAVPFEP